MPKKLNLPRINNVTISGRLTRDVELRYTPSGTPMAIIGIANDRVYKNSEGEWQQDPNFLRVIAWSRQAENAAEYLSKGSPVIVEGRIQTRNWEDKDGNNRKSVEIVAWKIQHLEREVNKQKTNQKQTTPQKEEKDTQGEEIDDDIPF